MLPSNKFTKQTQFPITHIDSASYYPSRRCRGGGSRRSSPRGAGAVCRPRHGSLWSRRGKRKPHRSRCQRRAHCGALIQLDGSHHDWLAGRGPQGCLLNFVGDATGLAPCRFASEETTWAAADLRAAWVRQHGLPKALYCDWKNVYKRQPTSREAIEGSEPETHFGGRLCAKLGMRIMAPAVLSEKTGGKFVRLWK